MNQQPHMHAVRDYFLFIDHEGTVWKLVPTHYYSAPPFVITLIHKA